MSTGEDGTISDVRLLLAPESSISPSKPKRNKKRKPRLDLETSISPALYRSQLQNTRDILGKFDLAPPTKRAMVLANFQSVGKYFANPGRRIPSVALSQQFYRALALRTEIQQEHKVNADGLLPPLDSELRLADSGTTAYVQERPADCAGFQIEKRKAETFDKLALGMCKSRYARAAKRSQRLSQFLKVKHEIPEEEFEDPLTPDPVLEPDEAKPSISRQKKEEENFESLPAEYDSAQPEVLKSPLGVRESPSFYPKAVLVKNSPQNVDESTQDYMDLLKGSPQRDAVDYEVELGMKGSPHPPDEPTEDYIISHAHSQEPFFDVIDQSEHLATEDAPKTEPGYDFVVSPEGVLQLVEYADDIPSEPQEYCESGGEVLEYQVVEEEEVDGIYQEMPEEDAGHSLVPITSTHDLFQECHEGEIIESQELDLSLEDRAYEFNGVGVQYRPSAHGQPVVAAQVDSEIDQVREDGQHQDISFYAPNNGCSSDMIVFGNQLRLVGEYTMATPGNENLPVYILCMEQPVPLNN